MQVTGSDNIPNEKSTGMSQIIFGGNTSTGGITQPSALSANLKDSSHFSGPRSLEQESLNSTLEEEDWQGHYKPLISFSSGIQPAISCYEAIKRYDVGAKGHVHIFRAFIPAALEV
jgi:hypothetical protein